jgi:DNA gyrase/topoisomerase IV subunit B
LQEVKKLARERAKAITIRIPQLKDCKNHFDKTKGKGKGTMVFLCEGQSASGLITSCRDVNNQAVFTLKGKPLNVWNLKRDIVYPAVAGTRCTTSCARSTSYSAENLNTRSQKAEIADGCRRKE